MGIHDLLPFLRKHAPHSFTRTNQNLSQFNIRKIAVDTPIFMHKFGYSVGSGRPLCERMLKFCKDLQQKGLEPIFCFDGNSLPEKQGEKSKRFKKLCRSIELKKLKVSLVHYDGEVIEVERSCPPSCSPIPEDYLAFKLALQEIGIETLTAKFEAEALCSFLCCQGKVDAVLSEDSDCVAYLAPKIILQCNTEEETLFEPLKACLELKLSKEQLQDLCVLFGNDFNERIPKIGPEKTFLNIKKHLNLDAILLHLSIDNPLKEQMQSTKQLFLTCCYEQYQSQEETNVITDLLL